MTTPQDLWKDLTVAALLGTSRKPFQPSTAGGALRRVLAQAAKASGAENTIEPERPSESEHPLDLERSLDPERKLLRHAAVLSPYRRAGCLPTQSTPALPVPCPADTRPRCTPRAGACLERIFTSGLIGLLPEWLEIADRRGQRAREEHLSLLLESQKSNLVLRTAMLPVLGGRGQWLAAQNPDWSAFTRSEDERIWHEGQRKERLVFLTDLRARDPQRAQVLLRGTWSQESPGERVAYLGVLLDQLSMDDEDFLESVLEDRRKDVRQAAATLLARLPESRLVQRMTGRVKALMVWKTGLLNTRLDVSLPEMCDEGMLRDGIEARPPSGTALGERAWWLAQMLGMVPPAIWSTLWNKRPMAVLEAIRKHEWENALLIGFKDAAVHCQDMEWLEALVQVESKREDAGRMVEFFPRLPPALKEKLMIPLLRANPSLAFDQPAAMYLSACRHPWSPELSQTAAAAICFNLTNLETPPWRWEKLLRETASHFHPDVLEAVIHRIAAALEKKDGNDPFIRNLLAVLDFRLEMRQAFNA